MILEILFCTYNDNIHNIKNIILPPHSEIRYLVSWQTSDTSVNIPIELQREDIKVFKINEKGLSKNRNNALKCATGDICLLADDDVKYHFDEIENLINTIKNNPSIDLFTFQYANGRSTSPRVYPSKSFNLKYPPKNYNAVSIEIAFRRKSIQNKIQFNENFGIGAPFYGCGEEDVFLFDALKNNLRCQYFPIIIVHHNHPTTSEHSGGKNENLRAKGALIRLHHPKTYIPRIIVNAYRLHKNGIVILPKAILQMLKGAHYAKRIDLI